MEKSDILEAGAKFTHVCDGRHPFMLGLNSAFFFYVNDRPIARLPREDLSIYLQGILRSKL